MNTIPKRLMIPGCDLEPLFALSRTTPGVVYQLRRGPAGWECACPGFYYGKECHHVKHAPASVLDVRTPDGTKRERDTVLPEVQPDHGVEPGCPQCRAPVPSPGECVNCLLFPYEG